MVAVIDDAELSGSYAVDGFAAMHQIAISGRFQSARDILGRMTDLKGDGVSKGERWAKALLQRQCERMEVVDREILLVGSLWIVAVRDI